MFLKIAGSIIVLAGCTMFGYFLSSNLSERPAELRKLIGHFQMFENSICYLTELLYEAFGKISKTCDDAVTGIFKDTVSNLSNAEMPASLAWERAVKKNINRTSLIKEDESILISFGKMLGNSDLDGQLKNIRLTIGQLEIQVKKAEEKRKKSELMFRRLGILVGSAIVIILI